MLQAHVYGVPVEETALSLGPVGMLAFAALSWRLRRAWLRVSRARPATSPAERSG